jgi:hypothetical protein
VDNAIVTTEVDLLKKLVIDGSRLEVNICVKDGKLNGDITIYYYPDDKKPEHQSISIPREFAPYILKLMEYAI